MHLQRQIIGLFFKLIVTMIFTLCSVPHGIAKTFVLSSVFKVTPAKPSQTSSHRKVTEERNKTGGDQQLKTLFFNITITFNVQIRQTATVLDEILSSLPAFNPVRA